MTSIIVNQQNSINRNILECKDATNTDGRVQKNVLIETYWNVKIDEDWADQHFITVLIETYWNVKDPAGV